MAFNPTKEQSFAINANGSVLVSAAAGSGKTAVLVERVIRLLTDESSPVMANRLLIVTFTNLAAAELRVRIEKRLDKEIGENPNSALLQKQKILLSAAHICTIDSFCIDFIKENFELSGINPSFKIADNASINYLKGSVLEKIFSEYFDNKDKDFMDLIYLVGADFDDKTLMDFVLEIFNFSRQMPYPALWIKSILEKYRSHANSLSDDWFSKTLENAEELISSSSLLISRAIKYLEDSNAVAAAYGPAYNYLSDFLDQLSKEIKNQEWDNIFNLLDSSFNPPALGRVKTSDKTEQTELAASLRKTVLDNIKSLKSVFYAKREEIINQTLQVYPLIAKLVEILSKFEKQFYDELYKRDMMTFYMCEQEALSMLTEIKDDKIVIRENASDYISAYDAVLVDEYQDTNDLQDMLFNILSDNSSKLFCVGDVKQSIYRFRGANPYNFLKKKENLNQTKIDLGSNFRSRKEICLFINSFFKNLMYKENSGFDYDQKEMLVPNATFPENNELKSEIHVANLKNLQSTFSESLSKSENAAVVEANIIADIIIEKMNAEPFIKQDETTNRAARYEDFAILCRSTSTKGAIFAKTLKERGIPVSVDFGSLLESDEVMTLIAFLKVINNPYDDISLLTLLTSPIFSFRIEELTEIRLLAKKDRLIRALYIYAKTSEKAKHFCDTLSYFTERRILFNVSSLIEEIFERTNYLNIVSRYELGEEKRSNLLSFQSFAAESDTKNISLRSFLQLVDNMSSSDFKKPPVFLPGSVKLMTVHASKGLQFPVCIIADASHQFNTQDISSSLLIDETNGFAFKYKETSFNPEDNIFRNILKDRAKSELLAEELRLLYVAMTRAEDSLIISATTDDATKAFEGANAKYLHYPNKDRVDISVFNSLKSYFDFLLAYLVQEYDIPAITFDSSDDIFFKDANLFIHNLPSEFSDALNDVAEEIEETDTQKLKNSYEFVYPFEELKELESKASVTEIVHKADVKSYQFSSRPDFMLPDGLKGTERGTAVHKFMQFCDLDNAKLDLEAEIFRLYDFGFITDAESESIDKNLLNKFFESDLYTRISLADKVLREEKFLTEFSATILKPDLDQRFSDEMIVVQGAVDLLFFEENEIVIVDFKTDRNLSESELKEAYSMQLAIYAKAIEKLYNKKVKELLIYSFALGKDIKIER